MIILDKYQEIQYLWLDVPVGYCYINQLRAISLDMAIPL